MPAHVRLSAVPWHYPFSQITAVARLPPGNQSNTRTPREAQLADLRAHTPLPTSASATFGTAPFGGRFGIVVRKVAPIATFAAWRAPSPPGRKVRRHPCPSGPAGPVLSDPLTSLLL
jgi:hypothetical protein